MAIVNTVYAVGHAQADGARYVRERHTDSTGKVHEIEYLAQGPIDYLAVATARAARLAIDLAELEFRKAVGV